MFLSHFLCLLMRAMRARVTTTTRFVNLHRKTWVPTGSNLASFALRNTSRLPLCRCNFTVEYDQGPSRGRDLRSMTRPQPSVIRLYAI